jgi:hypothetical protein
MLLAQRLIAEPGRLAPSHREFGHAALCAGRAAGSRPCPHAGKPLVPLSAAACERLTSRDTSLRGPYSVGPKTLRRFAPPSRRRRASLFVATSNQGARLRATPPTTPVNSPPPGSLRCGFPALPEARLQRPAARHVSARPAPLRSRPVRFVALVWGADAPCEDVALDGKTRSFPDRSVFRCQTRSTEEASRGASRWSSSSTMVRKTARSDTSQLSVAMSRQAV